MKAATLSGGRNSTQFDTIVNLNMTSGPELPFPGYSSSPGPQAKDAGKGGEPVKIMSQGVGQVPDEQLLMERLMIGYHRYARPVVNASFKVTVKFGLTLVQISDMVSHIFSGCIYVNSPLWIQFKTELQRKLKRYAIIVNHHHNHVPDLLQTSAIMAF